MLFVHVVGRTDAVEFLSQCKSHFWRKFYGNAWLGCIELNQQKPFARDSERNPVLGKQLFGYIAERKRIIPDLFDVHTFFFKSMQK